MLLKQFMFSVNGPGIGGTITWHMCVENFYINVGLFTIISSKSISKNV